MLSIPVAVLLHDSPGLYPLYPYCTYCIVGVGPLLFAGFLVANVASLGPAWLAVSLRDEQFDEQAVILVQTGVICVTRQL